MAKDEKTAKKAKKKAKYHYPPNILRKKVGSGGLPVSRIAKAEDFIDNNRTDFEPFARKILADLAKEIAAAREHMPADKSAIHKISVPIMQMKASGGMFGYALASEIAAVVLDFLESIDELNRDGFHIVDVHQKTLDAIIKHKLSGTGRREGHALATELYDACERYRRKYL
jgi:hypothetical protein